MISYKNILKSLIFYCLSALGVSLSIKASIGVSAFNAMTLSFSSLGAIKVGTMTMLFNLLFLLLYMIASRFKFPRKYVIQTIAVLLFGNVINLFYYGLLSHLAIESLVLRIAIIVVGTFISGSSVGFIVGLDAITFPVENLCVVVSEKTKFSFSALRYGLDILFISLSLMITFLFQTPFFIGLGTIISFLIFTNAANRTKTLYEKRTAATATVL